MAVDLVVILVSVFQGGLWLLNSQVAFLCSLLITTVSFMSYKNMVQKRVEAGAFDEEKDILAAIEDPHKLYDDEDEEASNIPKIEEKIEKRIGFIASMQNLRRSYQSALSPYRLAAYGVLFLTVLFLIRHNYLEAFAFFLGLSVVPLSGFIGFWFVEKKGFL